jgi:hypothetical protein
MYDRYKQVQGVNRDENKSVSHQCCKGIQRAGKEHGLNEVEKEDHSFNWKETGIRRLQAFTFMDLIFGIAHLRVARLLCVVAWQILCVRDDKVEGH